jgi:hypothetical protein
LLNDQITNINNLNIQHKNLYEITTGENDSSDWSSALHDIYNFRKLKSAVAKRNIDRVQKLVMKIPDDKFALIDELEEEWQTCYLQAYKDIRDLERKIEHQEPLEDNANFAQPSVSTPINQENASRIKNN